MEIVEGTVIAMHGPLVRVQVGVETLIVASRRRLNWEGGTPTAARLVVGDRVSLEMQREDGVIVAVHARQNYLLRKAPSKNRALPFLRVIAALITAKHWMQTSIAFPMYSVGILSI